jgi:hypothetical protein
MEMILKWFEFFFVLGCVATLTVINRNLGEIIVLLCRIINYQEALNPPPPRMPSQYNEP